MGAIDWLFVDDRRYRTHRQEVQHRQADLRRLVDNEAWPAYLVIVQSVRTSGWR